MSSRAREYIDYWIENSVHAAEPFGAPGASQDVAVLVSRLIEAAKGQRITEKEMRDEIGDLPEYLLVKLRAANEAEANRKDRRLR